jgi:ribonuclease VapC
MTLDSSAVLAILLQEPESQEFSNLIEAEATKLISSVSALEISMVLEGRSGFSSGADLDEFLMRGSIQIVPFDQDQLGIARWAFRNFGKGRHPAGLNFGDCAAYALSRWSGEPLLFKGTDFGATDVARVR